MTSGRDIDYEALAQDAMRGLVRTVLQRVAKTGPPPPGEHHFYISFRTHHPGVGIAKRLIERYPDEMTIVLQHMFERLIVQEDRFEVTLRFDGIGERLIIPFAAIKGFFDPSVPFGLQFESGEPGAAQSSEAKPAVEEKLSALAIVPTAAGPRARDGAEPKSKRPARLRPAAEAKPADVKDARLSFEAKPPADA